MDKNAIKKYAVWAREQLIEKVTARAVKYQIVDGQELDGSLEIINGEVLPETERKQRSALIQKIKADGYGQVMEEVAYTWFNRFIALRFMEVNGYLPSHVRVFTDEAGEFKPQIMSEALHLEFKGIDMEKVYELKNDNRDDDLFKYLLITQCNDLSDIFPKMFQRIADYTELLLPDYLLREGSVIEQMVNQKDGIPETDWQDQVQIIGWLYQYYNTEPKDKVFADLKKNVKITKETIPAATQLFTPDWIVHYMVENSLGRLWLEGHPNDTLKGEWKYYLDEAEQEPDVQKQLEEIRKVYAGLKPEEIRCIDPCMGSGHILCVLFDTLIKIYEDYGYPARDAAASIVENNLWGLDIDERAAQLAYFAVMMKARQYDRRFFTRGIQPNVYAIEESNGLKYDGDYGNFLLDKNQQETLSYMFDVFKDAKEYGSILSVEQRDYDSFLNAWKLTAEQTLSDVRMMGWYMYAGDRIFTLANQAKALSQKYHVVVTNPPYMGGGNMSALLSTFLKKEYPNSKLDCCTTFLEKSLAFTKENGYSAMIILPVWMFLSSYEKMRNDILSNNQLINMLHFGRGVFGSDFGSVAFVFHKSRVKEYIARYEKLFGTQGSVDTVEEKEEKFFSKELVYHQKQEQFFRIPGTPVAYWASEKIIESFSIGSSLGEVSRPRIGQNTGNNNRFLRYWFEVAYDRITFDLKHDEMLTRQYKWLPYNKGGSYRKWYGNQDYIIDWENDGEEIKKFAVIRNNGKHWSRYIQNIENMCRIGVTWTFISSSKFGTRFLPEGFICDVNGSAVFPETSMALPILALLNSNMTFELLKIENSTMSFQACNIAGIPYSDSLTNNKELNDLAFDCVQIAKAEWDSFEESWNFQRHPLLPDIEQSSDDGILLEETFAKWNSICEDRFIKMQQNEEKINQYINSTYSLETELPSDVPDSEITLRKADLRRDIVSLISYGVGCIFGRYSVDVPGVVCAGDNWNTKYYHTIIPDDDAILPICDDEYFEDDIVGKFITFIDLVYGSAALERNLDYIADAIGRNGSSRKTLREYFINSFYQDHCAVYSGNAGKRPIYWLFDSGKKNGFKCLVYMHRYQPDTIARIRTDYVHEQQARYRTAIEEIEKRIETASQSDKVKLTKKLNTLKEQDEEIHAYEEKIHHLADQMISIDLDDGVKQNYALFQDVLAKIK